MSQGRPRFGFRLRHIKEQYAGMPVRLFPSEVLSLADAIDKDIKEETHRWYNAIVEVIEHLESETGQIEAYKLRKRLAMIFMHEEEGSSS